METNKIIQIDVDLNSNFSPAEKKLGFWAALLLVLVCFTFPINQGIVILLGLKESTTFNVIARVTYLVIAFYLVVKNLNPKILKLPVGGVWFIIFYLLYLIRLIYDLEIMGIYYEEKSNFMLYSFSIGGIFIPSLAVILNAKFINSNQLLRYIFFALLLSNLSILVNVLKDGYNPEIFLIRSVVQGENNEDNILNPITIALFGESLAIYALVSLIFFRKPPIGSKLVLGASLILGILILLLGASRGPTISFFLLVIVFSFLYVASKRSFLSLFFSSVLVISLLLNGINYILSLSADDLFIVERFTKFANEGDDIRQTLYRNAWQQFLDHPFFGDKIVERTSNFYPHNMLLEVLMAMGVVGGLLFVPIFFIPLKRGVLSMKARGHSFLLFTIFLPIALASLTSGGLIFSTDYFVLSSLMLSYQKSSF